MESESTEKTILVEVCEENNTSWRCSVRGSAELRKYLSGVWMKSKRVLGECGNKQTTTKGWFNRCGILKWCNGSKFEMMKL